MVGRLISQDLKKNRLRHELKMIRKDIKKYNKVLDKMRANVRDSSDTDFDSRKTLKDILLRTKTRSNTMMMTMIDFFEDHTEFLLDWSKELEVRVRDLEDELKEVR